MPTAAILSLLGTAGPKTASHAFVCNQADNSLSAVNISNPSSMSVVSELTDATNLAYPQAIAIDKTTKIAWIAMDGRLTAVNIANPTSMSVIGSYANSGIGGAVGVVLDAARKIAFVRQGAVTPSGLAAINISNPASPSLISRLNIGTGVFNAGELFGSAIDIDRNLIFSSYNGGGAVSGGLRSIDVSDPANMVVLGTVGGGSGVSVLNSLAIRQRQAFMLRDAGTLAVIDVTNPASMSLAYSHALIPASGWPRTAVISGDILVAAFDNIDTLRSYNIANAANVTIVDTKVSAAVLDGVTGVAVDPYNGNIFAAATAGDEITSYAAISGTMTQLGNLTSGTQLNGAAALALL